MEKYKPENMPEIKPETEIGMETKPEITAEQIEAAQKKLNKKKGFNENEFIRLLQEFEKDKLFKTLSPEDQEKIIKKAREDLFEND